MARKTVDSEEQRNVGESPFSQLVIGHADLRAREQVLAEEFVASLRKTVIEGLADDLSTWFNPSPEGLNVWVEFKVSENSNVKFSVRVVLGEKARKFHGEQLAKGKDDSYYTQIYTKRFELIANRLTQVIGSLGVSERVTMVDYTVNKFFAWKVSAEYSQPFIAEASI